MKKYLKLIILAVVLIIGVLSAGCSQSKTSDKYLGEWLREGIEPSLGRPAVEHMLIAKQGNGYTVTISFETYDAKDSKTRAELSWQKDLFKSTLPAEAKNDVLIFKSANGTNAIILEEKHQIVQVGNKAYTKDPNKVKINKVKEKARKFMTEYGKDCFLVFRFLD